MDATALAASLLDPIPANASLGIRVVSAVDGVGRVSADTGDAYVNVIGSLHSSGLIALVDAAGLAAVISAAASEDEFAGVVPLGASAFLEFFAPARGQLTARCALSHDDVGALRRLYSRGTDRARLSTSADVVDEDGAIVCRGTFDWSIRRSTART